MNTTQRINSRLPALEDYLSGTVINYSKYLSNLVKIGKELKKTGSPGALLPLLHSLKKDKISHYQKVLEASKIFIRVWEATELDRVQIDALDGIVPYLSRGNYKFPEKNCYFIKPVLSLEEGTTLKEGQSYKATLQTPLVTSGAHYIHHNHQLFYIKNAQAGNKELEIEFVTNNFQGTLEEKKDEAKKLSDQELLFITTATAHTHIIDQRNFSANFNLNRSTQSEVKKALDYLQPYYNAIEQHINLVDSDTKEEGPDKANLTELDEQAFEAIKNYTTAKQDVLMAVGYISGIITSIIFGFVEGGSSMLSFLVGKVPLLAAKLIADVWGLGSTYYLQWKPLRSGTGHYLINIHGKDKLGEGAVRYHDATGTHELSGWNKLKLKLAAIVVGLTGLAMGALAHKSLFDIATLLSVGVSFAIPPLGMLILTISTLIIITINTSYMFAKGYETLLKSKKTIWQYFTGPFKDTYQQIIQSDIKHKNWAIGGTLLVFAVAYICGIGGLIISSISANHSLASVSDSMLNSGPTIAKWIGALIGGMVNTLGRLMFTFDRANITAKTISQAGQGTDTVEATKVVIASVGAMQTGLFFHKEQPFTNDNFNDLGGALAAVRDFEGNFGGHKHPPTQKNDRECDFFEMKSAPTLDLINQLPGANAAYIRVPGSEANFELFYINKAKQICLPVSLKTMAPAARSELNPALDNYQLAIHNEELLSRRELAKLKELFPQFNQKTQAKPASLLYIKSTEMPNTETLCQLVHTPEAYIRICVQSDKGFFKNEILYFNNGISRPIGGPDDIKKFDTIFGKKIQKMLQAKALTTDAVKCISKATRQYLHATSQSDDFRAHRVDQYLFNRKKTTTRAQPPILTENAPWQSL